MSSLPLSPEQRAARWGTVAKGAAILGVGFIVAPYVFTAITGIVGLIAAGAIIGTTWMLLPAVGTAAANLRLKLVKAEAARNPVETLQAEHLRQSAMLDERKKGIDTMAGAVRTLDQTIDQLEREFPDSPELPQLREDLAELEALRDSRSQDWQDAYVVLGEFAKEIQRVGRLWEVSLAAAKARQQSGLTETEWMAKLKTQTSIETIRTSLNTQLSALSTEKMQADADRILKGKLAAKAAPSRDLVNSTATTSAPRATKQAIS